jgi:hypothetical protein
MLYVSMSRQVTSVLCLGDGWTTGVRFPVVARNVSLNYIIQTVSGTHPASCPSSTVFFSSGVNLTGRKADHSLHLAVYLHSTHTPSWRTAQLSIGTPTTLHLPHINAFKLTAAERTVDISVLKEPGPQGLYLFTSWQPAAPR